jgi:hypothetical protein
MKPLAGHPRDATSDASVPDLDVATVVAASQALSAEIVLPALVERLVAIAVEVSGAARGLPLLQRDGALGVAARAVATGLQLVHDLADQLHGEVIVSRDAGTAFTIAFAAPGRDRPL